MKFLQINTNRRRDALDLALATAYNLGRSFILLSEPNKLLMQKRREWLCDDRQDSGIIILERNIKIQAHGSGVGYTFVKINDITIFSCYTSGNDDIELLGNFLADISTQIRNSGGKAVIAGDFNSKSPQWTENRRDRRGMLMEEFIAENDLVLLNEGNKPTFERENYSSALDLTLVTSNLAEAATNWDVLETESLSDHKYLVFEIKMRTPPRREAVKFAGWQVSKLDVEKFNLATERIQWEYEITPGNFSNKLRDLCRATMPPRKKLRNRKSVYWWSTDIALLRRDCVQKRRLYTRVARTNTLYTMTAAWSNYQDSRKRLRNEIKKAKQKSWNKLIEDIDRDIWGDGYKIAIKGTVGYAPVSRLTLQGMEEIANQLFPAPSPRRRGLINERAVIDRNNTVINNCDNNLGENEDVIFYDFTTNELAESSKRLKVRKAPGLGMVPPEVIKLLCNKCPEQVLKVYNKLYKDGLFPTEWKVAKLVLIPKKQETRENPSSYRPVCLLDVEGKLYESLIAGRLEEEIQRTGGLSNNQYGFRRKRQTVHAVNKVIEIATDAASYSHRHRRICATLTLDVKNAFNCASWAQILEVLHERGINRSLIQVLGSYLSNRKIVLEADGQSKSLEVRRGVPQGSILGPVLWNLLYDDLFKIELPEGVTLIGFADDVAMTVVAKTEETLMTRANFALDYVADWMKTRHLELAPQKTEAVILTRKRKMTPMQFLLNGTVIKPVPAIRYLGVWLDSKLNFGAHVNKIIEKTSKTVTALARIMPNLSGPRASKRKVLSSVVHSKILYAAPVWQTVLQNKRQTGRLLSLQRSMAIRVCSAYRTISTAAVGVIAALPPIDIMAVERKERFEGVTKTEARRNMLTTWQRRWEQETTGRWTFRLIPNIEHWIKRPYGEVDYFMTQALSGHGTFNKYLHARRRRNTSDCNYCVLEDDAAHTLFECIRWEERRKAYFEETGEIFTEDSMRNNLTAQKEKYTPMYKIVRYIMETKEIEDRQR